MNIIEYARKHSTLMKGIVTAGFLAGLAISSYSSAYSSYTGVTSPVENAYALKQKQTTVYYTKESQRAIMWEKGSAAGDLVGKRNATSSVGSYAPVSGEADSGGWIKAGTSDTPANFSSNLSIPVSTTGKVHRVKITQTLTGTHNHAGWYCYPYWTTASGSTQRYLTEGKQYVLTCYAKGKGKWIIGDEQDKANQGGTDSERLYTLSENSWTKVEQVFTANSSDSLRAFVQYAHNPDAGDYCDVTDVFIAEVKSSQTKTVLNPIGTMDSGGGIAGFKGWATTPDKCGVGYDSSDADGKTSDIVPVEGKVYYPVVKRYAIDVNCERDGGINYTDIPANLTLRINGIAVANNHHGDIFTSAPEGASYSLSIDSTDAGYRYKGLGTTGASFNAPDEYIKNYGVSIKGTGSTPATTALSGTVSGNMSFDLLFARVYKITWNLDGGSGSYETSYESSDNDYVVTPPSKSGYGFAGWTGTGLSASTVNLVIPKGSTGDRVYTAHWGSTPVEVYCEQWGEDYNGNAYQEIYRFPKIYSIASGTQISASLWGGATILDTASFVFDKNETITVSAANHIVKKLVTRRPSWSVVYAAGYDASEARATCDLDARFKDIYGNIIHEETKHLSNIRNVTFGDLFGKGYFGVSFRVRNATCEEGYALKQLISSQTVVSTSTTDIFSDERNPTLTLVFDTPGKDYTVYIAFRENKWDSNSHMFVSKAFGGDVSHIEYCAFYVKEPGKDEKVMTFKEINNKAYFPEGTTFRSVTSAIGKPGWYIDIRGGNFWYCDGGIGAHNHVYPYHNTFTLDAPVHNDGMSINQDAYGIAFQPNGGSGSMENELIDNTKSDDNRRLTRCTYAAPGDLTFKGWATSQDNANKGIVTYAENAVMPKDTNHERACKYVKLYAVWG